MDQQALWERAERLRDAADDAASLARKIFVTFLLLGTYIGIIIGSTTDVQLLKISPVTLPLLNVGLPILWFYAFVLWLFVLFHFNLLLQCYLLARKLHPLDAAIDALENEAAQAEQRVRLFAFPFSHMLIGRHHGQLMRGLMALIVWVTMVFLPLVLLVWAQLRFLRYHSEAVTWSQRSAVMVDLVMLWLFWPMMVTPVDWWWRIIKMLWRHIIVPVLQFVKEISALMSGKSLPAIVDTPVNEPAGRARGMFFLVFVGLVAVLFSFLITPLRNQPGHLRFLWPPDS